MAHDSNKQAPRAQCPEEVLAWIPWYGDGLLTARERGAVEAHAADCADCRAELDIVSGVAWACAGIELPDAERVFDEIRARIAREGATRDGATVIPISRGRVLSEDDMARLERWVLDPSSEQDLADEPGGEAAAGAAVPAPARRTIERRSRGVRAIWAAAAAVTLLALGGLGGASLMSLSQDDADLDAAAYALASAGPARADAGSAPMIDVVFSDTASARQIWSTLRGLGVEIVSGPTNLGVYRLRLRLRPTDETGGAAGATHASTVARQLVEGEAPIAIFAEPVP
ncbi:MAG: zf-HC2 domain-containing protein [Myxococcota bacterium]